MTTKLLKTVFEEKVADNIIKFRWVILVALAIVTAIFIYGMTILNFRVLLEDMLPPANPFVKLNAKYGHMFGGITSFAVEVGVDGEGDLFTPERLKVLAKITDDIFFLKSVRRDLLWSITMNKAKEIKGLTGGVFINAFMYPHTPETIQECREVKRKLIESPIFSGGLISTDGKYTLITGNVREGCNEKDFFNNLLNIKHKYQGKEGLVIRMIGRPVLMGWIYHFMPDMLIIFGISLLLILAVLSISFRSLQGLLVPFIIGIFSTVWGLGFMGIIRMNLNPLMIVLPFAVGIRAISHSIQITSRFLEEYARTEDKKLAAHTTVGAMFIPNISAIASDMAGFIFLIAVRITVVQQIAFAMTFWMFSIFVGTAILTPLICMYLPKLSQKRIQAIKDSWDNVAGDTKAGDIVDKIVLLITRFFIGRGRGLAIVGTFVVIIIGALLSTGVKSGDLSPGSPVLYPDSEFNRACDHVNKTFDNAGTDVLQIYFDGQGHPNTAYVPPVMQTEERLHKFYKKEFPDIYSGWDSVVPIIKKMNVEMHEGDVKYDFIPDDPALLGNVLGIYMTKLIPIDFNKYNDPKTRSIGNINYFFSNHMPDTVDRVVTATQNFFKNLDIDISRFGQFKFAGGEIGIDYAINHEIEGVHYVIIVGVLFVIFVLCAFSFRSVVAGILLIIPLIASNMIALAYMALKGIGVTVNTLPVISVGLGIGVDFGVYLYARFQEEYKNFIDYDSAILTGCITAGKGITYTALTMIVPLYLWYFISGLRFQGEMGLFLAIILTVNFLAVMIFHPAIVHKLRPKFVTRMTME